MSVPIRLRVEGGPNAGQVFTLAETGATIGRQDGNTIVLDDGRLSRQHARIDLGADGLSLTDLGSANGTRINGQRVSGIQPLRSGDTIQMGETTIVVDGSPRSTLQEATQYVGPSQGATTPMPPRPAGTPQIVSQRDGTAYPLTQPAAIIGRQPDNAITIEDVQSSRQHARFDLRDGQLTVTDLGSANGTRVNGRRIDAPTPLRDGDRLMIGTSEYLVAGLGGPIGVQDATDVGATALGEQPFAAGASGAGRPGGFGTAPLPPMSSPPPPQVAPPGQPWPNPAPPPQFGSPSQFGPAPQFGSPPPPSYGAPPPPQFGAAPAIPARRSRVPLLLGGVAVLLLLLCVGVGAGGFLVYRSRAVAPTPTVVASGTNVVGAAATPIATASRAATSPTVAIASSVPEPTATIAPTAAAALSPTARPTVTPAPTRAIFTPTPPQPAASAPPRTTSAPSASAGGRDVRVDSVGLRYTIPAGWTQETNENGRATFLAPDRRALITVRWSAQVPAGLTAQQLVQSELATTASIDRSFAPTNATTGTVTFGGQPGFGTEPYTFTLSDGTRTTKADRAVVLNGRAQYFFGFAAVESDFARYASIFDGIIGTVSITGPQR